MTGLDGTAEEVWFSVAAAGVERGYTVVVYDGPGQGGPLREHGMVLRPDWEAVVSPVIDVAVTLPGVDGDRMALVGRSFGGYLAPRAATVERRIAALVADPGQVDEGQAAAGRLPAEMLQAVLADDAKASAQVETVLSNPQRRFYFQARMRAFGASTVAELIRILQAYRFDPADIRCPTLVTDNVADVISGGQSKMLYDGLTCPKDYVLFTAEEGAEGHCEGLAQSVFSERLYDWLDQALDPTKGT